MKPAPKRSMLFLMVTAEEQGLLGSQYYADFPLYPLEKTLANINIDGINQWGRTKDLTVIGLGASDLDDYATAAAAEQVARAQGRTPNRRRASTTGRITSTSRRRACRRSIRTRASTSSASPTGYGKQKRDEYTNRDYHAPSDRGEAGLGSDRRRRGRRSCSSRWATASRTRTSSRSGRPGMSSSRSRQGACQEQVNMNGVQRT